MDYWEGGGGGGAKGMLPPPSQIIGGLPPPAPPPPPPPLPTPMKAFSREEYSFRIVYVMLSDYPERSALVSDKKPNSMVDTK